MAITLPKFLKREKLSPVITIVFNTTIALLFFGTLLFLISEYNGVLSGMNFFDKIINSFFHSVSARTAGFSSVDLSKISCGSYLTLVFLMIIGGSPGGTAGGIKTTTFAILVITCFNIFSGKKNVVRNREISPETIYKAIGLIFAYLSVLIISIIMLVTTQSASHLELAFEAVSAMGTVGLSMGVTPNLDTFGKIVIITTMFLGRVMPAMIIYYLNSKITEFDVSYPKAKISLT
jgi:trk system potassium uptake protein TrkH